MEKGEEEEASELIIFLIFKQSVSKFSSLSYFFRSPLSCITSLFIFLWNILFSIRPFINLV